MHFHAIVKASRVSHVSHGNFGQPDHLYWAVLKYIFLGPEMQFQFLSSQSPFILSPFYYVQLRMRHVCMRSIRKSFRKSIRKSFRKSIRNTKINLKYAERYKNRTSTHGYHSLQHFSRSEKSIRKSFRKLHEDQSKIRRTI